MLIRVLSQIPRIRLAGRKISHFFVKRFAALRGLSRADADSDDLDGLAQRLEDFSKALAEVSRQAEPEFLQLCQQLQAAFSDTSALAQDTVATAEQIGGESDNGVLSQIDRIVRTALSALRSRKIQVGTDLETLAKGAKYLGDLNNQCAAVDKMALMLRVVGLNIGVESSRTEEAREMFGVVAGDVRTLADKIIAINADIRDDAESAQNLQNSAYREISQGINALDLVAADAEQAVADAAGEIKNLVMLSLGVVDRAGVLFNEISQQVGEIVVGIQIHDNMNQRITHIHDALVDVAELCHQAGTDNRSQKLRDIELRRAHSLVSLQIAQLRQLNRELVDVHAKNTVAFGAIIERVEKLAQSLTSFDGGARPDQTPTEITADGSETSEDLFLKLNAALKRFQTLYEQSGQLHGQMQATFAQTADAFARLSVSAVEIKRIYFQIHIMALNAIVKSAHMGEKGRALEVLAQAAKDFSDQSDSHVVSVYTMHDKISTTAGSGCGTEPKTDAVALQAETGNFAMGEGIARITKAYEQLRNGSDDISRRAGILKRSLSATRNGLDFLKNLVQDLRGYLKELEAIGNLLLPWGGGLRIPDSLADRQKLAARYTMERERLIHEKQIRASGGNSENCATPPSDVDDVFFSQTDTADDDMNGNVELFISPAKPSQESLEPADPAVPRAANNDGQLDDEKRDFFDTDATVSASDAAKCETSDEDDLGDNIELF